MDRALLAVAVAAVALLAHAPAAQALIQIDRGIAGARLGNSLAQVRAALGPPERVSRGRNDRGDFEVFRYPGGLSVTFDAASRVTAVSTTGLGDRTVRGVGVGSSEGEADRKVAGVLCESIGGDRVCHTGDFEAGERITVFLIRAGTVARVDVGVVID